MMTSLVAEHRLPGTQDSIVVAAGIECGSAVVAHGLSCPEAG